MNEMMYSDGRDVRRFLEVCRDRCTIHEASSQSYTRQIYLLVLQIFMIVQNRTIIKQLSSFDAVNCHVQLPPSAKRPRRLPRHREREIRSTTDISGPSLHRSSQYCRLWPFSHATEQQFHAGCHLMIIHLGSIIADVIDASQISSPDVAQTAVNTIHRGQHTSLRSRPIDLAYIRP
jgi:hypothetical protein